MNRVRCSEAPREWDAEAYHRISEPQLAWGLRVLDRLVLRGDERTLDVGCGTARVTAELLARLPRGWVVACDRSVRMVHAARATLAGGNSASSSDADSSSVVVAAAEALPFDAAFDVIFSTATFHWVLDHPRLFESLRRALVPGGVLHAQCGGGPNLARLHERAHTLMREPAFATYFEDWRDPWEFADAATTATRLRAAGFADVETSLESAPTVVAGPDAYRELLEKVVLHAYVARLPENATRDQFLDALVMYGARDEPPWSLDYWRLNLRARKPDR